MVAWKVGWKVGWKGWEVGRLVGRLVGGLVRRLVKTLGGWKDEGAAAAQQAAARDAAPIPIIKKVNLKPCQKIFEGFCLFFLFFIGVHLFL